MYKKSNYEFNVQLFYKKKQEYIRSLSNKVKYTNPNVPLEADDLILFSFYKLLESENKLEYFGNLSLDENFNIESYFSRKIWNYMRTYCNVYKSKNHQVLNLSLLIDHCEENLSENYYYEDLFHFLTKEEFDVIYELKVNNLKRNQLAKKMNTTIYKLSIIEKSAKLKICRYFNINF